MAHIDTSSIIRGSIWIQPTGEALHKIDAAMRGVHKRVGGPRFKPHLTLLMGIETTQEQAEQSLRKLALHVKPFTVQLSRIGWRHDYYRCLFVTVELTEDLAAAHRIAHEVFDMNPPDPFVPHISLLYGDIHEPLQRQLAQEAGGSVDASFVATGVQLTNANLDRPVTDWRILSERRFTAS